MKELLAKFPEMIKMLLEKVKSQQTYDRPDIAAAKHRLLTKLQTAMDEMSVLADQIDDQTVSEFMEEILKRGK